MNIKQKGEAEVYNMSKMDNYTSKENLKSTKKVSNIPNPCEMILTTIQQSDPKITITLVPSTKSLFNRSLDESILPVTCRTYIDKMRQDEINVSIQQLSHRVRNVYIQKHNMNDTHRPYTHSHSLLSDES